MNYFYRMPPPRAYATTVDFRNPNAANIQQVLKESWLLIGLTGIGSFVLGATKLIPWSNPTWSYILGGVLLAGAGYGYMLSKGNNI
jgi:hypothetical protein